jgi:hypothetical protein
MLMLWIPLPCAIEVNRGDDVLTSEYESGSKRCVHPVCCKGCARGCDDSVAKCDKKGKRKKEKGRRQKAKGRLEKGITKEGRGRS